MVTRLTSWAGALVGTELPEEEAVAVYVRELQAQGWEIVRDEHATSKILLRGEHESVSVRGGPVAWYWRKDEDYRQARDLYPTIISVRVGFMLPGTEGWYD